MACSSNEHRAIALHDGAAAACRTVPPIVLTSRGDGHFDVNRLPGFDSAQLVRTLHNVLPPRPDKMVMVRLDPRDSAALPWIVAAIERDGGTAYKPDTACMQPSALRGLASR